jgi:hypothetical protein
MDTEEYLDQCTGRTTEHTTTMGYLQLKYDWCTNVSAYRMLLLVPYVYMYVCLINFLTENLM